MEKISKIVIKGIKLFIPRKIRPKVSSIYHSIIREIRHFFYKGNKYYCPFCGNFFRKFMYLGYEIPVLKKLKIIGAFGPNLKCPVCDSSDRERLLYFYIRENLGKFETSNNFILLHFAPEKNLQKFLASDFNIKYISADLASPRADIKMDITAIPIPDDSIDAIVCCHVLEHVNDDSKAMSEILRILKPNGWAILQVPISPVLNETLENFAIVKPNEREKIFGQKDHVRIYARDYNDRLESVGFKVTVDNFVETIDDEIIEKCVLNRDEFIYVCTK